MGPEAARVEPKSSRALPSLRYLVRMSVYSAVQAVVEEAEHELACGSWKPTEADRTLVERLRRSLETFTADGDGMSSTERLERLREGMAAVAITLASCHGPLAWFLGQCATALGPILQWRSLPADADHAFKTTMPSPEQLTDAERAFARLHTLLTGPHWS